MCDYYYMLITKDKYELPLVVADSAEELAAAIGVTKDYIYCATSNVRGHLYPHIVKVPRDDEEEGGETMINLKRERKKLNLSQLEMAEKVGISISGYCNIENNRYLPSIKTAKKIAEIINQDWSKFYE